MKKVNFPFKMALLAAGLILSLAGCEDHMARYKNPPWLKGTNIETLEKRGNCKIFLALMDKAGYTPTIHAQLFTLFVPNDSAFEAYFQKTGINSVDDLTQDQAEQLFTLHLLPNPRSRFQLIYEYIWSELQGPNGEYASLFFRKPTSSTSIPYYETVKYYPAYQGQTLLMYTGNKLMPVFSTDYFEDFFGAPDGSDYTYMYRDSKWANNINWGPAAVIESEVRTSSGFIYFLDRVVPPQYNIDEYMGKHQDKYGVFYDMMQRFATYGSAIVNEQKQQEFKKSYDMVSDLAEEGGYSPGSPGNMKDMFSLFLPTDQVMQSYLDNTVLKYYSSLDSVPKITLFYILQTQISRSLSLISKIENRYFNSFGDPTVISRGMITDAHMCSNGVIYETNTVLEPNVFTCVPGRLFFDANYSTMLYAINAANVTSSLAVPGVNITLFAPNNDQMEAYGIRYNSVTDAVQFRGRDNQWKNMRSEDLLMFVQDHIYNGVLDDLSGDGFLQMASGNFVHYANGQIQAAENQLINDKVNIVEKQVNDKNGILYTTDNCIKSKYVMGKYILSDPDLSEFAKLLISTKLLNDKYIDQTTKDTLPDLRFLNEATEWTGFIPNNAAMAEAKLNNWIPTNTDTLKLFLQYHFIRKNALFDDGLESGIFQSERIESISPIEGTKYAMLQVSNSPGNLSITDHKGNTVTVNHADANHLVRKGVAHKISHVLLY